MVAKRTWARGEFFRRAGHTAFAPQKLPMWKGELLATAAGGEEVRPAPGFQVPGSDMDSFRTNLESGPHGARAAAEAARGSRR